MTDGKPPFWQVLAGAVATILVIVVIVAGAISLIQTIQEWGDRAEACKQDPTCWGDKHLVNAESVCKRSIERYARYSHEWIDGFGGDKFSRWHMAADAGDELVYYGSKVRFQNGFGAWQRMRYVCHYRPGKDIYTGVAVNVSVEPYGR